MFAFRCENALPIPPLGRQEAETARLLGLTGQPGQWETLAQKGGREGGEEGWREEKRSGGDGERGWREEGLAGPEEQTPKVVLLLPQVHAFTHSPKTNKQKPKKKNILKSNTKCLISEKKTLLTLTCRNLRSTEISSTMQSLPEEPELSGAK